MSKILTFFALFGKILAFQVDFDLTPYSTIVQTVDIVELLEAVNLSHYPSALLISLNTTNPVSVSISKCSDTQSYSILNKTTSVQFEWPQEFLTTIAQIIGNFSCEGREQHELLLYIKSHELQASGFINFDVENRDLMRAPPTQVDKNFFQIYALNPYTKKVKLDSLITRVDIDIEANNTDTPIEVYISFCAEKMGGRFVTTHSSSIHLVLQNPLLDIYYEEYTCDTNFTFFANSSTPVAPLFIRLHSMEMLTGTMVVKVNGREPQQENHLTNYETGTYTLGPAESRTFPIYYDLIDENFHILLDIILGKSAIHLSLCRNIPLDYSYGELLNGTHQIDITLDNLMTNTTCSLVDIVPEIMYLTITSKTDATNIIHLWRPAEKATWHVAIYVVIALILLSIIMLSIIYLSRRKTGQLIISPFSK